MGRIPETLILLVICLGAFFVNLHRHDYIKTEGLRAVVVEEMLERPGLTMPTVHQTPYLKKPPLYAWTTTMLARWTGRFDEQIARLPSAICGTLFVLLMYTLGESWIGRGAGLPAAVFTLLSPTVADYAVRAELDLPFSFLCTVGIALALTAVRARGLRGAGLWMGAYLFALIASMWKGPHALIFMWLAMIGHGCLARNWAFLKSPAQWLGLAVVLAVLSWWAAALSDFAGADSVQRAASIELLSRLVPHRIEHLVSVVTFPIVLFLITVPASAFGSLCIRSPVRVAAGLTSTVLELSGTRRQRLKQTAADWWKCVNSHPLGLRVHAWMLPNLLFMMLAPAKSPRYSIPLFAPIFLMGAWMVWSLDNAGGGGQFATRVWRRFFSILAVIGIIALLRVLAGLAGWHLPMGKAETWWPGLILGIGCLVPLLGELAGRGARRLRMRLMLVLVVLLCAQPALHFVVWPRRAVGDSQRQAAAQIDAVVPPQQRVYVLGKHEFPDTQVYAQRRFEFASSIDAALAKSGAERAYAIVRDQEAAELTAGATASYTTVFKFDRAGKENRCLEITPTAIEERPQGSGRGTEPRP